MAKNVFKQVLIVILICLVACLIAFLVFYKYIPSNKVVPAKVQAYKMPRNVADEVDNDISHNDIYAHNEVYEITDEDLDKYKSTKRYNPGKSDPFSSIASDKKASSPSGNDAKGAKEEGKDNSDSNDNSDKNTSATKDEDKNSSDTYYEEAGTRSNGAK